MHELCFAWRWNGVASAREQCKVKPPRPLPGCEQETLSATKTMSLPEKITELASDPA